MAEPEQPESEPPELAFATTDELIRELSGRFQMCVFYGVPNDGEDHNAHSFYKAQNNWYEVLGMLAACGNQLTRIAHDGKPESPESKEESDNED